MEKETNVSNEKKWYRIKIIIVGNQYVGKTNIMFRYIKGEFNKQYSTTIGVDFLACNVDLNDKIFRLTIMDTAGQERFRSITRGYYKNVACALIVYDITDVESFQSVKQWIVNCQTFGRKDIHLVLVGNKNDLDEQRKVSEEEGKKLADNYNMDFFETSALTGENIEKVFQRICIFINKNIDEGKYDFDDGSAGVKPMEEKEGLEINKSLIINSKNITTGNNDTAQKDGCC